MSSFTKKWRRICTILLLGYNLKKCTIHSKRQHRKTGQNLHSLNWLSPIRMWKWESSFMFFMNWQLMSSYHWVKFLYMNVPLLIHTFITKFLWKKKGIRFGSSFLFFLHMWISSCSRTFCWMILFSNLYYLCSLT